MKFLQLSYCQLSIVRDPKNSINTLSVGHSTVSCSQLTQETELYTKMSFTAYELDLFANVEF